MTRAVRLWPHLRLTAPARSPVGVQASATLNAQAQQLGAAWQQAEQAILAEFPELAQGVNAQQLRTKPSSRAGDPFK
jgi:hypothetical protein